MSTTVGSLDPARRGRPQRVQHRRHVGRHRLHLLLKEQPREDPGQRLPVLHHVRDPGRDAEVVLQHPHHPVRAADEVDAGQVHPYAVRRLDAGGRPGEVAARDDQRVRHDAVGEHLPVSVDVGEERLQRPHPLGHPGLDVLPLVLRDQPRDQVQREDPLPPGGGERDALLQEAAGPRCAALGQVGCGEQLKRFVERLRVRVRHTLRVDHLVVRGAAVAGEQSLHDAVLPRSCYRDFARRSRNRRRTPPCRAVRTDSGRSTTAGPVGPVELQLPERHARPTHAGVSR